ncbi:MAG TPA: hypothetical protein VEI82_08070 [Myxococcota bacterium]|nr:hypothetical protein [Myxococcota bacterium]
MRSTPALLCAALAFLCGCATTPVRLERVHGAYSTHFEGIPDQAEACALVRNAGDRAVEWLELRMRWHARFGSTAQAHAQRSTWVYRGHVEPGAVVALRFVHPPVADELELRVSRAGSEPTGPHEGRPLELARECSEESLRAVLGEDLRGHTAPGIELRVARVGGDAAEQALVAGP